MARECVFCGRPANSREHVFPQWSNPDGPGQFPHFQQIEQDGEPFLERTWTASAQASVTVRAVCRTCNNGWMAELETHAKGYLEPRLRGIGRVMRREGQRTLAAWALKTLMMVEHTHGAKRRVISVEEYEHLYEHGEPSERVRVWMAAYRGTRAAVMGRMYGFDADMATDPDPGRGERDIWGGTIIFGPVVFQVFGTNILPLLDGLEVRAMNTHVLWPYQRDFDWLPRPGFNDLEVVQFADGLRDQLHQYGESIGA